MYEVVAVAVLWVIASVLSTYDGGVLGAALTIPLSCLLCGVLMQAYFSGLDNW